MNEIEKKLIELIQNKMDERGWKVADLSEVTGISQPGLYKIVNGKRWPGPGTLLKICTHLGITVFGIQTKLERESDFLREIRRKTADFSEREQEMVFNAIEGIVSLRPTSLQKRHKVKHKT